MKILLVILLWFAYQAFGSPAQLVLKQRGETKATLSLEQIKSKVTAKTVTVLEPHEQVERKYITIPFNELLTAIYGESWKKSEEVLFTCADGYQPSVPISQFEKYKSFLAFEAKEGAFKIDNKYQNEKQIELGPYYLIWDNLSNPELKKDGATYWPYQVVGIDLILFRDRFPNMAPPEKSSRLVKSGFVTFKTHCMSCHSINGEGAPKATELNYPSSVTEYFKEGWIEKWILNPRSLRYNTTMPAFTENDPQREQKAKAIVAYLKVMAKQKRKPEITETEN